MMGDTGRLIGKETKTLKDKVTEREERPSKPGQGLLGR